MFTRSVLLAALALARLRQPGCECFRESFTYTINGKVSSGLSS